MARSIPISACPLDHANRQRVEDRHERGQRQHQEQDDVKAHRHVKHSPVLFKISFARNQFELRIVGQNGFEPGLDGGGVRARREIDLDENVFGLAPVLAEIILRDVSGENLGVELVARNRGDAIFLFAFGRGEREHIAHVQPGLRGENAIGDHAAPGGQLGERALVALLEIQACHLREHIRINAEQ